MAVKPDLTGLWGVSKLIRTGSNWFGCSPATLSGGLNWLQSQLHPLGVEKLDQTRLLNTNCNGAWNHKGWLSQNCLACCSFDLLFLYVMSRWARSAADATVWMNACLTDLPIPANKFYLADAGFGACDAFLMPYCGAQYHLAEWGHASVRYVNLCVLLLS